MKTGACAPVFICIECRLNNKIQLAVILRREVICGRAIGVRRILFQKRAVGIAYGHTKDVQQGMTCTQSQAEQWLLQDVEECVSWLNNFVTPCVQLTQGEFDALVDFSFNLGLHALAGSTLLSDVLANKMALAAAEFEKWDRAGGQVVDGLLRRRLAEKQEFMA